MKQVSMFTDGSDLPLFSGTPIKVEIAPFVPQVVIKQLGFFTCAVCRDTGIVGDKLCWCEAGRQEYQRRKA